MSHSCSGDTHETLYDSIKVLISFKNIYFCVTDL